MSGTRVGISAGSAGSWSRSAPQPAEFPEHRAEGLPRFGQLVVLGAPCPDLSHDSLLLEGSQPCGEDVGWDAAEALLQLGVAARSEEQVANDE